MSLKLFVIVRKDLHPSQQAVQAGHAVAEFLLRVPDTKWRNGILVYLGVDNEEQLNRWTYKLDFKDIEWAGFREPDIGNQLTAIASVGNDRIYSKLKLI